MHNTYDQLDNEIVNAYDILQTLKKQGIITTSDVQNIHYMKKINKVDANHEYKIWQGEGKDSRFFTYISDEDYKCGRRKIAKTSKKDLYEYLYELYFGDDTRYNNCCLQEIYLEWLQYKDIMANRSNYIRRIDNDYQKYYINEPLSRKLLTTPLKLLKKIDIEMWSYGLIKKYSLTKKAYYNMSIIIRQVLVYLIDKDILERSPFEKVKIPTTSFRKVRKAKSETQIFYRDELVEMINLAHELADEKKDENYLAIPLIFYSGIRLGECLGLMFEDFQREDNLIYVHQSLVAVEKMRSDGTWEKRTYQVIDNLKHNADAREVLVSDKCFEVLDTIKQLKKANGRGKEEILFSVQTPAEIEYKLYSLCEKLGYFKRSAHKIRKTYISELINNRADLDFVREQVGHQNLKTTLDSYTFSTTRKAEQLNKLNAILV
ncbi:MAG: tyrosine-type recombinase/integrase [Eubacteriales bacterium]